VVSPSTVDTNRPGVPGNRATAGEVAVIAKAITVVTRDAAIRTLIVGSFVRVAG
jgi:hypothetical protein